MRSPFIIKFFFILFISLIFLNDAFAEDPVFKKGLFLDAQVGISDANYDDITLMGIFQPSSVSQVGIAPRFNFGYDFNRYIGVQLGVIYFHRPTMYGLGYTHVGDSIKHNLVNLTFKASAPVQKWDFNLQAGVGYVVRGNIVLMMGTEDQTALQGGQYICPVYGLGIDRRFSQHWGIDASWLQAPPNAHFQLPVSNFYGVGVFYKF